MPATISSMRLVKNSYPEGKSICIRTLERAHGKPTKTLTFRVFSKNGQSCIRNEGVAWRHCKMASQKSENTSTTVMQDFGFEKNAGEAREDHRISPRQCAIFTHLPALSYVLMHFHALLAQTPLEHPTSR